MPPSTTTQPRPFPPVEGVTHRFVEARGVRFHVAEAGPMAGDPVLLLHGFPQHWYAWRHVIPPLSDSYHLLCPDLRGFGWSDAPEHGYDTENRVADLLRLMDMMKLDRVRLIAHDWGARTGFLACLRAPERFTHHLALNMIHPWPNLPRSLPHAWRYGYTALLEVPGLGRWILANRPQFTRWLLRRGVAGPSVWRAADLEEFVASIREPARAGAGAALHRQYAAHDILPTLLGRYHGQRLTVPTLLMSGAQDRLLSPQMLPGGERFSDTLDVRIVPGCGHFLADEHPALLVQAAKEFFGSAGGCKTPTDGEHLGHR
jgi:pimeloyl-ACP methyl ester carboxylesterase